MSASSARRPTATPKLASPAASEMIGMFAKRNPKTSRAQVEVVGKLVAEFGAAAAKLSPVARRRLVARKTELSELIAQIVAEPAVAPKSLKLVAKPPAEISRGEGLGVRISAAEGSKRLAAYATPLKVETWAGAMAGATELERDHGIARSTLHAWQKQGAVIGLLVGVRKHAFPVEQFIDGRPVAGLAAVLETIGDPRIAWLWLREPNPALAGASPLARLKSGAAHSTIEVARSNFAQG